MELALSLEKLNFTKLRELWKTASEGEDGQLTDFIGLAPCAPQEPFFLEVACSGLCRALSRGLRQSDLCELNAIRMPDH